MKSSQDHPMNGVVEVDETVIGQRQEFKPFFKDHIDQNASIRVDGWRSYRPLIKDYPNLKQELSGKKGDNFSDIHRCIMMLKSWLRGVHHSVRNLQDYLDEYVYRFNRSFMKGEMFDNLILRAVEHPPVFLNNNRLSA